MAEKGDDFVWSRSTFKADHNVFWLDACRKVLVPFQNEMTREKTSSSNIYNQISAAAATTIIIVIFTQKNIIINNNKI